MTDKQRKLALRILEREKGSLAVEVRLPNDELPIPRSFIQDDLDTIKEVIEIIKEVK
jgi:hypothetical protein